MKRLILQHGVNPSRVRVRQDAWPQAAQPEVFNLRLLIACLIVMSIGSSWTHNRGLLEHATKVVRAPHWFQDSRYTCCWLSDHVLLLSSLNLGPEHPDRRLVKLDLRTGAARTMTDLTRQLPPVGRPWISVSPDSKWALFGQEHEDPTHISMLNGSRHLSIDRASPYSYRAWMPDSHHWIEFVTTSKDDHFICALLRRVGSARILKRLPISPDCGLDTQKSLVLTLGSLLVASLQDQSNLPRVVVIRSRLAPAIAPTQRYLISLPPGRDLVDDTGSIRFSPTGDRLAWLLRSQTPDGKERVELWVSRFDGKAMHEIGRQVAEPDNPIWNLNWLPDGQHLSFVYKDALYIVSALSQG